MFLLSTPTKKLSSVVVVGGGGVVVVVGVVVTVCNRLTADNNKSSIGSGDDRILPLAMWNGFTYDTKPEYTQKC